MSATAAPAPAATVTAPPPIARQRIVRYTYAILGVLFLAVALIGIPVPGIPTTGPLLASMFFMTRSCPRLQEYVLRWRVLRPYLIYLDGKAPIPAAARISAGALMWLAILISCLTFASRNANPLLPAGLIAAGVLGTGFIAFWRRRQVDPATIAPPDHA